MKNFLSLGTILLSCAINSFAAEYPANIQGEWGDKKAEYCPWMTIDKNYLSAGTEYSCEATKVTTQKGKHTIVQKCSSEGGEGTMKSSFAVEGDTMTITTGKKTEKYQRCGGKSLQKNSQAQNNSSKNKPKSEIQCAPIDANQSLYVNPEITSDTFQEGIGTSWTFVQHSSHQIGNEIYFKGHLITPRGGELKDEIGYINPKYWDCGKY